MYPCQDYTRNLINIFFIPRPTSHKTFMKTYLQLHECTCWQTDRDCCMIFLAEVIEVAEKLQ